MDLAVDVLLLILILFGWVALLAIYLAPTVIAFRRQVVNKWSVAVVNVLLGWTLVGWVVALAMAVRTKKVFPPQKRWIRLQGRYSAK